MDLTNIDEVRQLLGKFRIRPNDRLGQNFLVNKDALEKILQAAELQAGDKVLEIGAGLGTLTAALAERCQEVIAVEKDKRLIKPLNLVLKKYQNIKVINDDILKIADPVAAFQCSKVVANIPYYLTGEILRRLLSADVKPQLIVLLLQKEVAKRITGQPGEMSIISAAVQFYSQPEIFAVVPAESFWPAPKVDSAIVRIRPYQTTAAESQQGSTEKKFFRLVKIGFSARRKTLVNNLSAGLHIPKEEITESLRSVGLNEKIRAQELSVDDWKKIFHAYKNYEKP